MCFGSSVSAWKTEHRRGMPELAHRKVAVQRPVREHLPQHVLPGVLAERAVLAACGPVALGVMDDGAAGVEVVTGDICQWRACMRPSRWTHGSRTRGPATSATAPVTRTSRAPSV